MGSPSLCTSSTASVTISVSWSAISGVSLVRREERAADTSSSRSFHASFFSVLQHPTRPDQAQAQAE